MRGFDPFDRSWFLKITLILQAYQRRKDWERLEYLNLRQNLLLIRLSVESLGQDDKKALIASGEREWRQVQELQSRWEWEKITSETDQQVSLAEHLCKAWADAFGNPEDADVAAKIDAAAAGLQQLRETRKVK